MHTLGFMARVRMWMGIRCVVLGCFVRGSQRRVLNEQDRILTFASFRCNHLGVLTCTSLSDQDQFRPTFDIVIFGPLTLVIKYCV